MNLRLIVGFLFLINSLTGYAQQNSEPAKKSILMDSDSYVFALLEQPTKCSQEDVDDAQKLLNWAVRNSTSGYEVDVEYYRMLVNETKSCASLWSHHEYCTAQMATLKSIEAIYLRGRDNPNLPEIYRLVPAVHIRNRMILKTRCAGEF